MGECDLARQGSVCLGWVGPRVSPVSGYLFDTCSMPVSVNLDCSVFSSKMLWKATPNGVGEIWVSQR